MVYTTACTRCVSYYKQAFENGYVGMDLVWLIVPALLNVAMLTDRH